MRTILLIVVILSVAVVNGCTTLQRSAATGGMLGAMTGAIIGHQSGEAGAGAGIGAGVGALVGALAQDYTDYVEQRAIAEYRAGYRTSSLPCDYRGGTRSVDGHYEYETRRVWVDTSRDERVWVPEHYAGGRRIEGHHETKHITDGYWKTIEEKIWVLGY
jgi:uncharacterized protein YcfJ